MPTPTPANIAPDPPNQNRPPPPPPAPLWHALKPRTPQQIAVSICSLGLVVVFFCPWVYWPTPYSPVAYLHADKSAFVLWAIPVLSLATFALHKNKAVLRWLGVLTPAVVWLEFINFFNTANFLGFTHLAWGGVLALLLSLGLFGFSGERRFTAPVDLVVKKLGSRKADILSHSGTMTPEVYFSAEDFYSKLESALAAKKWPGVEVLRVPYSEAGLLSHKREYLRIIRQRHLFDVCASTFGQDYFFTLREGHIPAVVDLRAVLVVMLASALFVTFSIQMFGTYMGSFVALFFLLFVVWFLFNILKMGMTKLDSALVQLPAVGPVYEAYLRPDTYFQQDTRMVFLQSVSELVKKEIEETTSAKGLKFLTYFEKQPILEGIYKRSRVKLDPGQGGGA